MAEDPGNQDLTVEKERTGRRQMTIRSYLLRALEEEMREQMRTGFKSHPVVFWGDLEDYRFLHTMPLGMCSLDKGSVSRYRSGNR